MPLYATRPHTAKGMMIRPLALLRMGIPLYVFLFFVYLLFHSARSSRFNTPPLDAGPPLEIAVPKTVHQLLISMPGHPVADFKPNSHSISWQQSGWKVEYWSEDACIALAKELQESWYQTIQLLPTAVLRSDFCRYLVIFGRGGVYNDLDVQLMKPLPWPAMGKAVGIVKDKSPPAMIIGLEGDAETTGLARSPQFVQWTIVGSPLHTILRMTLDQIADRTPTYLKATEGGQTMDVMSWTGPRVWTDAVLEYLDCTDAELEHLRNLQQPLRIRDVLFLPKRSFAIIQGQDHSLPDIYVKHYFSGTWKTCKKGWFGSIIPGGC